MEGKAGKRGVWEAKYDQSRNEDWKTSLGRSDRQIIGDLSKSYFSGMLWAEISVEVEEQVREVSKGKWRQRV